LNFLNRIGVNNSNWLARPNTLTILTYHRIDNVRRPGFDLFAPVVVSPGEFTKQIDFIQRYYHVTSCQALVDWLKEDGELPSYSAMITFDDGYYDNYAYAYPILRKRNLPAICFLTTNHIEKNVPFSWDFVSYCFNHSKKNAAYLPLMEHVIWNGETERKHAIVQWNNCLKEIGEADKPRALADLAKALDVTVPEAAFSGLYMSWDQVREISQNGIEIGSHTESHPILTSTTLSQVETELVRSKQKIEHEIKRTVIGFAYPNGREADFSSDVKRLVRQAGYEVAFSLAGGSSTHEEVRQDPLAIRRIFVNATDTFPRFIGKVSMGRTLAKIKHWVRGR